jgi:spore maturation protein CgeB
LVPGLGFRVLNNIEKKVLFITPEFYNYPEKILYTIRAKGYNVEWSCESPSSTVYWFFRRAPFIQKIFISKFIVKHWEASYQKKILIDKRGVKFDYLFVINGSSIHPEFLYHIKKTNPHIKCIKYHWDCVDRMFFNVGKTSCYYDTIFSFEEKDCKEYGFKFLPLFYINDYSDIGLQKKVDSDIDLLFIGQYHSDRYEIIKSIQGQMKLLGLNFVFYIKIHPLRFFERLFNSNLQISDFNFFNIASQQRDELVAKSGAILDIQAIGQDGLTMRTFEVLAAKRKLITTNTHIKNKDFFSKDQVLIIDRNNIKLNRLFFSANFTPCNIDNYSIDVWVDSIFKEFND